MKSLSDNIPEMPSNGGVRYPLPDDYPILYAIDAKGNKTVLVRYGDGRWDFSSVAGRLFSFYFYKVNAGVEGYISDSNWAALKAMTAFLWFKYSNKLSFSTIQFYYKTLRSLLVLCTRFGVDIRKSPLAGEQAIKILSSHNRPQLVINLAYKIYVEKQSLGFYVISPLESKFVERLLITPVYDQTPYIPDRIWVYQLGQIDRFLNDFIDNISQFEKLFSVLITAYRESPYLWKRSKGRVTSKTRNVSPFNKTAGGFFRFFDCLVIYGLKGIIERWMVAEGRSLKKICEADGPRILASYCTAVSYVGLIYLANVSGMRKKELSALRANCSRVEEVESLGKAYFLCSETTKTIDDAEALWVADEFSEKVVDALAVIARMRIECARIFNRGVVDDESISNPLLSVRAYEPWGGARGEALDSSVSLFKDICYSRWRQVCPNLFDDNRLVITEDDYLEAKKYTPSLDVSTYRIGGKWPLALHQLRRTVLIRAVESGVSMTSIQYQGKHRNIGMSYFYTGNFQGLNLSREMTSAFMDEVLEKVVRDSMDLTADHFVSIYGDSHKAKLIEFVDLSDLGRLKRSAQDGTYSIRQTFFGVCLKKTFCSSGGVSYVADCLECAEGLGDKRKIQSLNFVKSELKSRLCDMVEGDLDYMSVKLQISAVERAVNFLAGELCE